MDTSYSHAALERLIENSGLSFRKRPSSYVFDCPRCGGEDKLYIRRNPPDGKFVCWVCGEEERDGRRFKGRPEWALTILLAKPVREIQDLLYGGHREYEDGERLTVELKLPPQYAEYDTVPVDEFQDLKERCWDPDMVGLGSPAFLPGAMYLAKRGIGPSLIQKYDLRYHPPTSRVIIPVKVDGRLLGWQGRYIYEDKILKDDGTEIDLIKVISTKGLSGGQVVMFQDNLKGAEHGVLAEGPFDAMKLDMCGGNVAAMGKGVKQGQLKVLLRSGIKRLYMALDRDAAVETTRIVYELSGSGIETYLMVPPEHRGDFGDCTPEETLQQFKAAEPITPSRLLVYLKLPTIYQR
jgi:hypothetical protein